MKKPLLLIAVILSAALALLPDMALAQQKLKVSGRVVDGRTNEPLSGAAVQVKGTTRATSTDFDGQYVIEAAVGEALVFKYMGMVTQEVAVGARSARIDVSLKEDAQVLEELVVVGYGTQKKESVVGAISQVKGTELMRTGGVTSVSNALTGLVPGLTTLNTSGKPGADNAEIIIRSKSTWNGAEPLILIDGVERGMNDIDIAEIESISVLKDASATAVFGVRGGNGVILITTKRGKEGKPVLSASANISAKTTSKIPRFLNSYQALKLRNEVIENQLGASPGTWASYITPVELLGYYRDQTYPEIYPDVDWQKEMLHEWSWSQRYSMDVRGGTKFVKYFASLAYTYDGDVLKGRDLDQGYIPKNDFQRYNFRVNLDFQPTKTTVIGIDLDGAQGTERTTNCTPAYLWLGVYGKGPDQYPVRYSDGYFANITEGYNMYNPVEYFNYGGLVTDIRTDINANFSLNQKLDFITKGLSFKALANFRNHYTARSNIGAARPYTKYIDWRSGDMVGKLIPPTTATDKTGFEYEPDMNLVDPENVKSVSGNPQVYRNVMYQGAINYNRSFGRHTVTGLANFKRTESGTGNQFITYREEWAARATYDYAGRYMLEGNGAYNGSQKFGPGRKFGFFPSAALGWVVSQEPLFKKLRMDDYFNFLKFRYSWGKVGSDNNIPAWLYVTRWSSTNNTASVGVPTQTNQQGNYPGYTVTTIGNPTAGWETAIKNDVAVETAFLRNRLTVNYDYYWGRRDDIFMSADQRNVPPWFGADPVPANLGKTTEKGWELEARWNHTTAKALNYYFTAMISQASDRIEYMEDPELTPAYQRKAGFPIGQQHAYIDSGVVKSWDEMYNGARGLKEPNNFIPGMYQLVDYNGDGVIDDDDWVPYGYSDHPQYTFSFTAGLEWKGLSVMLQFYGARNSTLGQAAGEFSSPHNYSVVDRSIVGDFWLPRSNTNGSYHVPTYMLGGDVINSGTYNMVDGTLWRLKTAEVAYRFSGKSLKSFGIEGLRVFVNGNNLFLWSHLNEDRETGGTRDNDNVKKYPMSKRINLGVKVEF